MKIQISIADPSQVADSGGNKSVVFGVIETAEKFESYTKTQIAFDCANGYILASKKSETEILNPNLSSAPLGNYSSLGLNPLDEVSTHGLLKLPIFHVFQCEMGFSIADILIMESDIPSKESPNNNTYYFVGIVSGDLSQLKEHNSKLLEVDFTKKTASKGNFTYALATDTGVACPHKMGTHFTNELALPIWGFGEEKFGRVSVSSDFLSNFYSKQSVDFYEKVKKGEKIEDLIKNPFGHNENRYGDTQFRNYLVALGDLGGLTDKIWMTKDEIEKKEKLAKKALKKSLELENEIRI